MGLALGRGLALGQEALGPPHKGGKEGGARLSGRGGSGEPSCSEASALVACVCGRCHGLGIPARLALHGLAFCDCLWAGLGYFGASRM